MYDQIIWSADSTRRIIVETLEEKITRPIKVKIDRAVTDEFGLDIIEEVNELGFDVFDDAKISEIPTKLEKVAQIHLRHRPWMLNCMVGGALSNGVFSVDDDNYKGELDGLKRFANACFEAGTLPCGVTVLTSKTGLAVYNEYNNRSSIDQVLFYTEMMIKAGFSDMVCSTAEVAAVRQNFGDEIHTNVPGIRLPGSDVGDQARVGTPAGALAAGATRLVIGRDITENPVDNIEKIYANMCGEN